MLEPDSNSAQIRKLRHGARGARKAKTGCATCKTRHKKCDERRPECSRCLKAGWRCDFLSSSPSVPLLSMMAAPQGEPDNEAPHPMSTLLRNIHYPSARPLLTETEVSHMEYFHLICAKEFAVFFDLPVWEPLILQHTVHELVLHHAALAIGALSRSRYHPPATDTTSMASQPSTAMSFATRYYGLAMQALHNRLYEDHSVQNLELAALASVVFSQIEFLLGIDSQLVVHLRAGYAVLGELGRCDGINVMTTHGDGSCRGGDLFAASSRHNLLSNAVSQLTAQVESFRRFGTARL
ncbi:hypothetical protein BJX65DRAFT_265350 [Aspergillus insuetus]